MHMAGGFAEFVGEPLAVVIEEVGDHHLAAPPDDVAAERGAKPSRAARDHDDLACQLSGIRIHLTNFPVSRPVVDSPATVPHYGVPAVSAQRDTTCVREQTQKPLFRNEIGGFCVCSPSVGGHVDAD